MKGLDRHPRELRENAATAAHQPIDASTLFRRHAGLVAGFIRRLGVAETHVDDLVQDVFLGAHRKGGWRPGANRPTAFLCGIAVGLVANHRRSLRRSPISADPIAVATVAGVSDPGEQALLRERLDRVQAALAELDEKHRSVFVMSELYDASAAEISTALDVPIGTVYSRLYHARKKFIAAHDQLVARDERGTT